VEYKDYYKILGLDRKATPAEIKKSYRRLARELHPDRNPGDKTAEARFKEVNEANEVLSDATKRQQYDMLGANWDQVSRGGAGAGAAGYPFGAGGAYSGDPFAAGGPFAGFGSGGGNVRYEFQGGDAEGFSDFFRVFFGGAAPAAPGRASTATQAPPANGRGKAPGRKSGSAFDDIFGRLRSEGATTTQVRPDGSPRNRAPGAVRTSTSKWTSPSKRRSPGRPG
jgi:curved DNA-binding protein CbpA